MRWIMPFVLFTLCCVSAALAAYDPATGVAAAPSLGGIAGNIMHPLSILSEIGIKIFLILGVGFLMAAAIRYRGHRANPNHVRMGEVLMLLILGLVLIVSPLLINQSQGAKILDNVREGTL